MRRILLTGSRDWDDPVLITEVLDSLLRAHGPFILVHGDCRKGADAMGRAWAISRGITEERHTCEWRPNGVFDPLAGFRRNETMVDRGADEAVSFEMPCRRKKCQYKKVHPTHGTSHCATYAETGKGIPVHHYKRYELADAESADA